jgi:light-regulated signal transduction histidine kinase (bacteriophytochrome)
MKSLFSLRSIRHKLFVGVLLTTVSALLISGVIMIVYDLRDYRGRLIEDLTTQSNLLGLTTVSALQFNDPKVARSSLASLKARPQILAAAVYDNKGKLFATYRNPTNEADTFPQLAEMEGHRIADGSIILFSRIIDRNEILGTIYLKATDEIRQRVWQYARIVLVVSLPALIISMVLSLWLQAQVSRPILRITDLARRITEQRDFSLRAQSSSDDEIGFLTTAFNDLLSEVESRSAALELSNTQLHQQIQEREKASDEILRLNTQLEQRVTERTAELERANGELEAFSYSVSHDLRTPLRAIDGFSQALLEDYADQLDETGRNYLARVRAGAQRMGHLIDDLLKLAKVSRAELHPLTIDLSEIARKIVDELREANPERRVAVNITSGLTAHGDAQLLRIALENLLNNAWKYSGKRNQAEIEFGMRTRNGEACYFVEDNGAGFDMAYASKLFGAFQRLHDAKEFPGTGVGLATVQRIIHRHGGHIWAEAVLDKGSTFYFTLPIAQQEA